MHSKMFAYALVAFAGGLLGVTSSYFHYGFFAEPFQTSELVSVRHFDPLQLTSSAVSARAAIVYDPQTGDVLFAKNAGAQLPLASLTKLATARAALSLASGEENVVIQLSDLKAEGDSGLRAGDVWRLTDLIGFGLTTSSNDAMAAVASSLTQKNIVAEMNSEAQMSDMPQSYFLNPTGLDISSSTAGAYGSALDVAHLVTELLREHPEVLEATTKQPKLSGTSGKGAEPTTEPIWDVPGLIAAKTGYTDLAGGNLAVVVDLGLAEPVVVVVLGSTREGRFNDVRTLIEAARNSINK